jgi:hypothetical protein
LFGGVTKVQNGWFGNPPAPNYDLKVVKDLWEWNGSEWIDRTPSPLPTAWPPERQGAGMVYDSKRKRVVVFGGASDGELYRDLWELSCP